MIFYGGLPVANPELVSRGVSKRHKWKGLVKVGTRKGVIRVDFKNIMTGGGVPGNREKTWFHHCLHKTVYD